MVEDGKRPQVKAGDFAAQKDVGRHVQVFSQRQCLVNRLDTLVAGIQRRVKADILPIQRNLAFVGLLDAGDQAHERAFARAVVAHDGRVLTRHQPEIGIGQGLDATIVFGQAANLQHGVGQLHGSFGISRLYFCGTTRSS